jgi:hypothetical protein
MNTAQIAIEFRAKQRADHLAAGQRVGRFALEGFTS